MTTRFFPAWRISRTCAVTWMVACALLAGCGTSTNVVAGNMAGDATDASVTDAQDATPTDAAADVTGVADTAALVDAVADSVPDTAGGCTVAGCPCTTLSQCTGDHPTCRNGACGNAITCVSDNGCKSQQQVCDTNGSGTCVDCVKDTDCNANQQCIVNTCHDLPTTACASSKTCPGALVCDPSLGKCVECAANADCPGQICVSNVCVAPLCVPGASTCVGSQRNICSADGMSFTSIDCPTGCASGQCAFDGDAKSSEYEDIGYLDGLSDTSQNVALPDGPACTTKCPTILAKTCGYADNCGVPCSGCVDETNLCSGSVCVPCKASCATGACGPDGCGGFCTACTGGNSCDGDKCVPACDLCFSGSCDFFDFNTDLNGWDLSGDATLTTRLGVSLPPDGGKMLRISSGLGPTIVAGSARKALCIPGGASAIRLIWRFYSEEFIENCGSQYQDEFKVTLEVGATTTKILDMHIDDLCSGGAQYIGLVKSDVGFDQGDVWNTPWHETIVPITLPPGSSDAVLTLTAQNGGDNLYDTVVLLDDIQFLP